MASLSAWLVSHDVLIRAAKQLSDSFVIVARQLAAVFAPFYGDLKSMSFPKRLGYGSFHMCALRALPLTLFTFDMNLDLPTPAILHDAVGTEVHSPHIVHRADIRVRLLAVVIILQRQLLRLLRRDSRLV